jgi:hypothetical protein
MTALKTHEPCLKGAYDRLNPHLSLKEVQRFGRQRIWYFNFAEDGLIHTGYGNLEEESFDNGNVLFHSSNVDQ